MSKTPEERYDEIKREIIQISESYVRILNMDNAVAKDIHMNFLHYRLRELVSEMKTFSREEVEIPLVYKKMINRLMTNLSGYVSKDYIYDLENNVGYIRILL